MYFVNQLFCEGLSSQFAARQGKFTDKVTYSLLCHCLQRNWRISLFIWALWQY